VFASVLKLQEAPCGPA